MSLEFLLLSPIIIISFLAVLASVTDAVFKNRNLNFWLTVVGLIASGAAAGWTIGYYPWVAQTLKSSELITGNMVLFGGYSAFFDLIFCFAALLVAFASKSYLKREYNDYNEYYSIMLYSIAGMMLISHADNLIVLFVGIEIMSICFYILAGFFRVRERSIEAAIKYFLLGSFATGFLIYGIALIYGSTATISLSGISSYLKVAPTVPIYFPIGIGLLIIGLSFKVAAFPFHQWAPDVYHGSPTVISAFFSTAGKAAAISAFIAVANSLFPMADAAQKILANTQTVQLIIAVIAAITMLIANITALVQKNVKRMLSYSSVAHAGYMLMGIVANNPDGKTGMMFYATAYMLMQIGAFVIISILERNDEKYMELNDYAGLRKAHPALAALMAMFMLSLAGIPPFSGFIGKYYLFVATVKAGYVWLTIVAVLSSIISMYYYIGLILQMYFKESGESTPEPDYGLSKITLALAGIGTLVFGVLPSLLVDIIYKFF